MKSATSSPTLAKPSSVRYGVLGFACALSMITYLDRACIGVASKPIRGVLGFTNASDMTWAFTAFSLAYALFEVPTGWLGDVFGPRKTLIRIVLWWSLFTALTGLTGWKVAGATLLGFGGLVAVRFLFGIGEAGAYPNITRALHNWFPLDERAFTQGAVWMSGRLMGGLTPLVWFLLVEQFGLSWRVPFFLFGFFGLCWCAAFVTRFRNRPEEHPKVNEAEKQLILAGSAGATANAHANVPWLKLLSSRNLWMLCLMYFFMSFGWYFNLNYLPEYLEQQHNVKPDEISGAFYKGGPLCFGAVGCILGGVLSDRFIRRTGDRKWGRRVWGMAGHALCVPCYLACLIAPNALSFALAIALSGFFNDLAMGSAWATCQDIGKRHAAIVAGCMNTIGNLGGAAGAYITGTILSLALSYYAGAHQTTVASLDEPTRQAAMLPGYEVTFWLYAAIYVVSVFLWLGIDSTKPVVAEPGRMAEPPG